jgi:hypothetical protein
MRKKYYLISGVLSLLLSSQAFGKVPEKEIVELYELTYCSAILEYLDSGDQYDKIKSHKLINAADRVNSKLIKGYGVPNVIEDRSSLIQTIRNEVSSGKKTQETISWTYDYLKCDLKI